VDIGQAFVADGQPSEAVQPGEGALDDPAVPPQLLAGLDPSSGDTAGDPASAQVAPAAGVIVALIGVQLGGPGPWATVGALDRLDGLDQLLEDERVVDVGCGEPDCQRDALPVDHNMALRARFAAIRRVRADLLVRPAPPLAGTLEPSRLARDQSIWSASPRRSSRTRWRRCQTPARSQSRKRRQQVIPLPQPSSWGRYSQGSPVLSTNRMPVSTARSETLGRPPLGLGGSGGSSGAIASQSASLTRGLAISNGHYRQPNRRLARF
jgi:hypothetical protein